jgi:threonine/homoserine efflux transporter RhtA
LPQTFAPEQTAAFEDLRVVSVGPRVSKSKILLLTFAVTALHEAGNLSLAWGLKHVSSVALNPVAYIAAMLNPFVAAGIVFLTLWLLTRMALMSWADLSFALPLMAVGYVLAAVLGHFVLHENVNTAQWWGVILIFAGSALVGATPHQTYKPRGQSS